MNLSPATYAKTTIKHLTKEDKEQGSQVQELILGIPRIEQEELATRWNDCSEATAPSRTDYELRDPRKTPRKR